MANPPFNVDMVDEGKVKGDRRLPFGLPGVNKSKSISNANYLWISYFHSYLNKAGRAGFVMSSQASSAGHDEAKVRQKLVATGDVDVMMSIRSNFFYTRSVPCELWFFDKGKPAERKDSVLMLDARNVYRKVTRKIFDFTPEQQKNLSAIVWLYRGQRHRFARLAWEHREEAVRGATQAAHALVYWLADSGAAEPLHLFVGSLKKFTSADYHDEDAKEAPGTAEAVARLREIVETLKPQPETLMAHALEMSQAIVAMRESAQDGLKPDEDDPKQTVQRIASMSTRMDAVDRQLACFQTEVEGFAKAVRQGADIAEKQLGARRSESWRKSWQMPQKLTALNEAVEALRSGHRHLHYFLRQVHWLLHRFPEASYVDVPGLCKIASRADIAAADWSLTPGRYVGVAPAEVDEDFDFGQSMRDIHVEMKDLDREASELAAKIQANFEGLGI